jgi:hypothetical protein
MTTEAINISALEALLSREGVQTGNHDPVRAPEEHPLARELRSVLAAPNAHRIGDLARVVDSILKEMSLFKAAHGVTDDPEG